MTTFRVEELAERAGISVILLRSYQSKGLLPPPRHQGRVAFYGPEHLDRLRRIADLKARGYSLKVIGGLLDEALERPTPLPTDDEEETFGIRELAERCRVPPAMLRSLGASGILRPRRFGTDLRYTNADVRAVRMLLSLIGGGLPMEEFLRVAHVELEAASQVAREAVELFMHYVRAPLRASRLPQPQQAERMVAGLRLMLHASATLMTYNFQRMVLNEAQDAIEREGTRAERAALAREVLRHLELAIPA